MKRVRSYQKVKEPSFMHFLPDQRPGCIQVAVVMGDCHSSAVTREPAVAHAGGCKSKRLSFACIASYGPFKAFSLYEVFLGPFWSLGLLWPFTLGALVACLHECGPKGFSVQWDCNSSCMFLLCKRCNTSCMLRDSHACNLTSA